MPRRDGTGPMGMGAMTGRGVGMTPANPVLYATGCGRGKGRGFGSGAYANYSEASAKEVLETQKDRLENMLSTIEKQLESL